MIKLERVECFICMRRLVDTDSIGTTVTKCPRCKNIIAITGVKNPNGKIEYKQKKIA